MNFERKEIGLARPDRAERDTLVEITNELVSMSDVNGAAIVRIDGTVISWHTNEGIEPRQYIESVLDAITQAHQQNLHDYRHGMFNQKIINYNGHKILISRVRAEVMLVLLINKTAYLGLVMLDMEGCLRKIEKVMYKCCS